jgi:hypothetical protein
MQPTPEQMTIHDILELRYNNMLTVNPEYQRGEVWTDNQRKKLIDSVLRNYRLPLIYLHHRKKEIAGYKRDDFEIIDGQQRISALSKFHKGGLKLFDPIKDDKVARFPNFIKQFSCTWAHCTFDGLSDELKKNFLETKLFVIKLETENEDEARDLFIRLQSGLALNAQEKRDAWAGGYTEFVLRFGGKKNLEGYPGHEFFQKLVEPKGVDRGETRKLCAQIGMLFLKSAVNGNWTNIGTQALDDYYYENLGFSMASPTVKRFNDVLDKLVFLIGDGKRKRLKGHEAIHLVLLIDSLFDDYTKTWEAKFSIAFDKFREYTAIEKKKKTEEGVKGEYWNEYGQWTQTSSDTGEIIKLRHNFFTRKMFEIIQPKLKDPTRGYGQLEREIIYYRDKKKCVVCTEDVKWEDLEIHHVDEHQNGGPTTIENGVTVHKQHHPKGQEAVKFAKQWEIKRLGVGFGDNIFQIEPLSPPRQQKIIRTEVESTIKETPQTMATKAVRGKSESEEIEQVKRKIPKWFKDYPRTICSKILVNYMEIYFKKGSVSLEELEKSCSDIGDKLEGHLRAMNGFGIGNHAKIFEENISHQLILWKPVKDFIVDAYNDFLRKNK